MGDAGAVEPARDMDADEAREFVAHVRASVADLKDWIVRAVTGRAWIALGHPSWDAMCEAEFDGAVIRLPREDRRDAVASLREAGLSTRAIGTALGVHKDTVRGDLASGENSPVEPGRVQSLDGRERPASQPATKTVRVVNEATNEIADLEFVSGAHVANASRDQRAVHLVRKFPELAYYADAGRTDDLLRLGHALDAYDEPELSMRRGVLAKSIAAEQRRAGEPPAPPPGPDWDGLARQMFLAANQAAQLIARHGGADTFARAIAAADPIDADNWHGQFADLANVCTAIAEQCKPKLRRIK